MRDEYDFSKGKRRALIPTKGKTRITIYIDEVVIEEPGRVGTFVCAHAF